MVGNKNHVAQKSSQEAVFYRARLYSFRLSHTHVSVTLTSGCFAPDREGECP